MKNTIYVLLLSICLGFTQTEDAYQSTLGKISSAYNAKNADQLFSLFSTDLQAKFTLDQVKSFITLNQTEKGAMGESTFLIDEESNKKYLVEFENASSILILSLSPDQKINHFSLEEY